MTQKVIYNLLAILNINKSLNINENEMINIINQKTILVTGGGGSIGSFLCEKLIEYNPKEIIIFDIYENSSYMVYQNLMIKKQKMNLTTTIKVIIGSVYLKSNIKEIFKNNEIDYVFHTAAYKHVPLMEEVPIQAINTNCIGTYNVAYYCNKYKVKKMVLISTDKAINPLNVMGASKKIAEDIVLNFSKSSSCCKYSIVRFGNVFNSNGSLIPILLNQLDKKCDLTITHKDATRYFISISDAISLILYTLSFDDNNVMYVLDMGKQIKIQQLAEELIKQYNMIPYKDVKINYIGLRKGEKIVEEILDYNNMLKTKDKHIYAMPCGYTKSNEEILDFLKKCKKSKNIKNDILNFVK